MLFCLRSIDQHPNSELAIEVPQFVSIRHNQGNDDGHSRFVEKIRWALRMTTIDKKALRNKLLSFEAVSAEQARKLYEGFLSTARLNRAEQMDEGDRSQAVHGAAVAENLEEQIHAHLSHREILESLSLHPMTSVDRGAIVTVNGRNLFLAVPTQPFTFQGMEILGISCEAPLAKAMLGLGPGDAIDFKETQLVIEAVQ